MNTIIEVKRKLMVNQGHINVMRSLIVILNHAISSQSDTTNNCIIRQSIMNYLA